MRITDLIDPRGVELWVTLRDKEDAIEKLIALHEAAGDLSDKEPFRKAIWAREAQGSTAVGEGIAIPHAMSAAVKKAGIAVVTVTDGVDFQSLDGKSSELLFMIAVPQSTSDTHIEILSRLMTMLMDPTFKEKLLKARSVEALLAIIDQKEQDKFGGEETARRGTSAHRILAVTACPTGIAHTYMAAEALQLKAGEMGVEIKVETNGSAGVQNLLTQEEIDSADGIIVAADKQVDMSRFEGKRVLKTRVSEGIKNPEELIGELIGGAIPIYHQEETDTGRRRAVLAEESVGRKFYKHLMNGISHMLPFVVGGGIMVAIAFLIDSLAGYGATGGADFGSITPAAAFFKYVGSFVMNMMVPVLAGFIAESIADRPGLAVGFAGGLLAANGSGGLMDKLGLFGGNTVSGFLGGIAAGFLAGGIVLGLKKATKRLPGSLDGIRTILIYPFCGILILGALMCFVLNPLIGLLNVGLGVLLETVAEAGLMTLLGLLLGAMMAVDMGGPINKAAYVFGAGMLAQAAEMTANGTPPDDPAVRACYIVMACIMAGGMVPPVGIAIACFLFPSAFSEEERETIPSNLVMGASFITEGAIPFAAADPARVIPAAMAGAGVAGFLSALFRCTLMAPHGGVFVIATIGHPLLFLTAWFAGSAVTALLLGLLKSGRKRDEEGTV